MTIEEIRSRIQAIANEARDHERAHVLEDKLFEDFVRYVATFKIPVNRLAKEVLRSKDIDFERWCG